MTSKKYCSKQKTKRSPIAMALFAAVVPLRMSYVGVQPTKFLCSLRSWPQNLYPPPL